MNDRVRSTPNAPRPAPSLHPAPSRPATGGGLLALLIWSSTVALSRSLMLAVGPITGAALAMGIGGSMSLLIATLRGQGLGAMLRLDRRYLLGCGGFFVAYMLCFYAGLGLSPDNSTALVVGLLNYLWPVLLVALSVPILHQPARAWLLICGCAVTFVGTALAQLTCSGCSIRLSAGPLAMGLCAGVLWPLYSNFARRWGPSQGGGAVPLFLLASAGVVAILRLGRVEEQHWSAQAVGELLALSLLSIGFSYVLWETGMRKGNNRLLGLVSYFVPIASMAVASCYLRVAPNWGLFAGAGLVVIGAFVSRRAIRT